MEKLLASLVIAAGVAPALAADCDIAAIQAALETSTANMKPLEIEVADVQSTEGGIWQVFRQGDGRVHSIIRADAGESGRNELRLSPLNRKDWGIAETRTDYIRHAFADNGGPFADVRKTTNFYYFCGGVLYLPPADWAMTGEDYAKSGNAAKAAILDAKEVAPFTKGLAR